jgi:hypothetical protein
VEHCGSALAEALSAENGLSTISVLRAFCDDPIVGQYWEDVSFQIQADIQLVRALMRRSFRWTNATSMGGDTTGKGGRDTYIYVWYV